MKHISALKFVMKEKGMSTYDLNKKIGYPTANTVAMRLSREETKVSSLIELVDGLDYELVLRPKNTFIKRSEEIILDGQNHENEIENIIVQQ